MSAGIPAIALDGEPLDALIWRVAGQGASDELVLEANRGLAELGPILPEGTLVLVPEAAAAPAISELIQLWD
jgi:phage tail protein X